MNTENCPCKRINCERHGNCAACKAYHQTRRKSPAYCEKTEKKEHKRAERAQRRSR